MSGELCVVSDEVSGMSIDLPEPLQLGTAPMPIVHFTTRINDYLLIHVYIA